MSVSRIVRSPRSKRPAHEGVGLEEAVVELPEGPARVGDHVAGEPVDRLELGQEVGVVEVGGHGERLGHQLLERGQLEGPPHQRPRGPAHHLVGAGDRAPALRDPLGDVEQRPQRRDQRHPRDVERVTRARPARRSAGRARTAAVSGREDPAERPADDVHLAPARVRGHLADRSRDHLVDPVLHAEVAVLERDLSVLDEVGGPAPGHEVLDQGAAAAQVEAERRRGQRGHQQDRVALLADLGGRSVVVDLAQRPVADQGARHRAQVGQSAVEHLVRDVAGRGDDLIGLRDQIHGTKSTRSSTRSCGRTTTGAWTGGGRERWRQVPSERSRRTT